MPTVHREVERLEEAGLVRSHRVGNVRLVEAEESLPYHQELEALLLKTFGPAAVLGDAIVSVSGVEEAYIFGSWARRYHGEAGAAPGDIDLLVVGSPDPDDIYELCRAAEEKLGNAVNPNIGPVPQVLAATLGLNRPGKSVQPPEDPLGRSRNARIEAMKPNTASGRPPNTTRESAQFC